jgi:RsiW-degrading membrane proteinase PrsW (M82 family)
MTPILAFFPVLLFMASLLYIDSYKLVRPQRVIMLIAAGGAVAVLSYLIHRALVDALLLDRRLLTQLVAPAVEEALKLLPLVLLIRRRQIGFVIDAAICGFAAGAGFALVENLYYFAALARPEAGFWIVRGFGTAVMHGGTTAIAAIITKAVHQRTESASAATPVPGFLIAFAIHSLFNQFILPPLASTVAVMVVLPPLLMVIFSQSERFLQRWLGDGFDLDAQLLQAIRSGDFSASRPGRYLQSLRDHFDGAVLADMLCYLRLQAELSLRAKGILMLRENGLPVTRDAQTAAKLEELRYLRGTIGRTGRLALEPILPSAEREVWQMQLLESD